MEKKTMIGKSFFNVYSIEYTTKTRYIMFKLEKKNPHPKHSLISYLVLSQFPPKNWDGGMLTNVLHHISFQQDSVTVREPRTKIVEVELLPS